MDAVAQQAPKISRKRRRVTALMGIAVMLAVVHPSPVCSADNSQISTNNLSSKLKWAPQKQLKPNIEYIGVGPYSSPTFSQDQDVIIRLPKYVRDVGADIIINGGRHVKIIGGHTRGRIYWRNGFGSLFIEGVLIDVSAASSRDAIVVSGAPGHSPDVYLQKIFVTGVQGSFLGVHADIFQAWGPIGALRVDQFTGDSNYQGFFIRPEFSIRRAEFSRVNLKFNKLGSPVGNSYLMWFRNMSGEYSPGDPFYPVTFSDDVYVSANARSPRQAAAFPPPGTMLPGPLGRFFTGKVTQGGSMTWPSWTGVEGRVRMGAPKDGDFVQRAQVGLGYKSPGYE